MLEKYQTIEGKKNLNGRWSKSEHERFLKGYQKFGRNWVEVQKIVKTRTLTQVRSHAQKAFLNQDQNGINQSFDSEDSAMISYQDTSMQESVDQKSTKKTKLETKKAMKSQQNILTSLVNLIQEESREKSATTASQQASRDDEKISLPTKPMLQLYITNLPESSYFINCLVSNFSYFAQGGTFIDLATQSTINTNNVSL